MYVRTEGGCTLIDEIHQIRELLLLNFHEVLHLRLQNLVDLVLTFQRG